MSDHLPVFIIRKTKNHPQGYSKIKFRVFSDENIANFAEEIASVSTELYNIISSEEFNINEKSNKYFELYKMIYHKHFPLKMKKIHNKTLSKPWITNSIQKLIKKKNFLYYKKLKQPTEISVEKYKSCKKELDFTLKLSKKSYFERKMFETSRNMKERWDAIRLLINKNKNKNVNCPIKSEILGNHFSTIAEKLNAQLPDINCEVLNSIANNLNFGFDEVNANEIYNITSTPSELGGTPV